MFHKVFSFLRLPRVNKNHSAEIDFKYLAKEKKSKKLKEVFANLPRVETKRLILRRIESRDCEDMFEYSADLDVTKYLTWQPHTNLTETKNYLADVQKKYENGKFFDWGLVYKPDGRFVGTCGFTTININQNTCEVGYVLSKKYWGMGLMPEALDCVMDFAFNYFGFDKIEARFLEGNTNSQKVMVKVGMTCEKIDRNVMHVKGESRTVHTYSITREQFEARKNAANKIVLNRIN